MTRLDQFRTRPMKNLSGGMKQKLGWCARSFTCLELIVLDEPTTGVDPVSRRDFWVYPFGADPRGRDDRAHQHRPTWKKRSVSTECPSCTKGKCWPAGPPDDLVQPRSGHLGGAEVHGPNHGPARARVSTIPKSIHGASGSACSLLTRNASRPTRRWSLRSREAEITQMRMRPARPRRRLHRTPARAATRAEARGAVCPSRPIRVPGEDTRGQHRHRGPANSPASSATSPRWTTSPFKSSRGRSSACWGRTARASPPASRCSPASSPSSGEGHVSGADMREAGQAIKERIGYVSQVLLPLHRLDRAGEHPAVRRHLRRPESLAAGARAVGARGDRTRRSRR